MEIPFRRLRNAIEKLKSLQPKWEISVSYDPNVDGGDPHNYQSTMIYRSSDGLEVTITQSGDEGGNAPRPWSSSILVCQDYADGSPRDQLYFGSFEIHEDTDEFRLLSEYVRDITASARQDRAKRLEEARASFFRLNSTTP